MQLHQPPTSLLPTPLLALALLLLSATTALILPLPTTNLTGWSIRNCVADPTWNPPSLLISPDCKLALLHLEADTHTFGPDPGIFTYSNNGHSGARFAGETLALPKRYVSGQCVVAVVMMKMFEEAGLRVPGLPRGVWPDREEVRWRELVRGAGYVGDTCANGCGYATVGRRDGVVVVVWEVESLWDRFVRGEEDGASVLSW